MREAIERVIAELDLLANERRTQEEKTKSVGGTGYVIDQQARKAYEKAINLLKEVLANEKTNSTN